MDNRTKLAAAGFDEAVVFENPDYDEAIAGITDEGNVVYNYYKMVEHLQTRHGMTADEAVEFIDYNTVRALPYAGDNPPIIMTSIEDL